MSGTGSTLNGLTKQLALQWETTKGSWNDPKSLEFEQKFLHELFSSVDKAATAMDELDKLMRKIRSDCE